MRKAVIKLKLKKHEILFLIAGLVILISLPWLEMGGIYMWIVAKATYFIGVLLFVINLIKEKS